MAETKGISLPVWTEKEFSIGQIVYVFAETPDTVAKLKSKTPPKRAGTSRMLYAIKNLWIHDPQGLDREYLYWRDDNGKWLGLTLADPIQRLSTNSV